MLRFVASTLLFALLLSTTIFAQQAPQQFTISQLLKVRRVGDPQISPDGRAVAYTITDIDEAANRGTTHIYLVPTTGGEPKQLATGERSSSSPRWSPDGRKLAFVSTREGAPQIWTIDLASNAQQKITNLAGGASDPLWSPNGKLIAFTSDVYPECANNDCNKKRADEAEASKVKARVADRLLYRHWTSWKEGKRSHIFVAASEGGEAVARDMTPGDYDAPPFSLGGPLDYAFSPDSKELAFVRNTDKVEATSTNGDIFTVAVTGGEARRITSSNPANDASPAYSPDGRFIAYRAQQRPGFESDRWQLMLYDRQTNQTRSLTNSLDAWIESFQFSPDGQNIYFAASERGLQPVYAVAIGSGSIGKVVADGFNDDVQVTANNRTLVFTRSSMARPSEIYRATLINSSRSVNVAQLTTTNDAFLSGFNLQKAEQTSWEGANNAKVYGYMMKPANFTPSKKYPMIVLIHGGPQGAWNDNWGYRWNPQVFANAGYVVFMPNPRGSTGYGQKFIDEISQDWGGKAYTDIMNGVAQVAAQSFIDRDRIGAAGGSYGGYMVNWIEGHNNDPRVKFKALVSHAGVFNLTSMYGATEELWFTDWEFGGTPWNNPEVYTRWSPHMYVKNFKTPLLVVHGEQDFRVPVTEGLQLFTALQRQGVESKLLYFPDEGHWILKPQNSELWYKTVLGWFDAHLKEPASAARN